MSSMLLDTLTAYADANGGGQGLFRTPLEAVNVIRSFQEMIPHRRIYHPSLCVVAQGTKQILFGGDMLDYGAMECLVVSVELPASGRICQASQDRPFVGMTIDFDVAVLRDVLEHLEAPPLQDEEDEPGPCAFVGKVDAPLADCMVRLVRMMETPKAIPVLYPAIMREISYWLLSGPHGAQLGRMALPETNAARIARALYLLRDNFTRAMRVEQLAGEARMSASSFHQHFKKLTSMTPLQYQKQLRLIEARRLMVSEGRTVSEAAYQVGYESTSQFSREYSRMFGLAPKRNVTQLRAATA